MDRWLLSGWRSDCRSRAARRCAAPSGSSTADSGSLGHQIPVQHVAGAGLTTEPHQRGRVHPALLIFQLAGDGRHLTRSTKRKPLLLWMRLLMAAAMARVSTGSPVPFWGGVSSSTGWPVCASSRTSGPAQRHRPWPAPARSAPPVWAAAPRHPAWSPACPAGSLAGPVH